MIFEFDIDGTLVTQGEPGKYHLCEPLPGALEKVNKLFDLGHIIIFHTARHWKHFELTYNSMKKMGFKFHSIVMGKTNADVVVDDRAVSSLDDLNMNLFKKALAKCCDKQCEEYQRRLSDIEKLEGVWDEFCNNTGTGRQQKNTRQKHTTDSGQGSGILVDESG